MRRTQIQLTEEQANHLRDLAAAENRSMADVIRESVELYMATRGMVDRAELEKRALAVIGKFHSQVRDLGVHHDKYLFEDE